MCTLLVGIGVLGPGTLVVGANRDESPGRPAAGPAVLRERPLVVGGRDLVAGGTWLAVRDARVVSALMNRRPRPSAPPPPPGARSRGLLCLDAAASGPQVGAPEAIDPGTGERDPARLRAAVAMASRDPYAPCTLVGLEAGGVSWALAIGAEPSPRHWILEDGWHVITHEDPDDRGEPRTAWLLDALRAAEMRSVEEALDGMAALLRIHADPERGVPGSCLHRERFPTVSSSLLALGVAGGPRYLHASGPPCTAPYADVSGLLTGSSASGGGPDSPPERASARRPGSP